MSNKKTRKNRKQKGGSVITFLIGALSGGILASFFNSSSNDSSNSSSYDSVISYGGSKSKNKNKNKNNIGYIIICIIFLYVIDNNSLYQKKNILPITNNKKIKRQRLIKKMLPMYKNKKIIPK